MQKRNVVATVDAYIARQPKEQQVLLKKLRETIQKAAPKAEESISYAIPTYKLEGPLVYFASYAEHVGFYAMPSALIVFRKDLTGYKCSKGGIRFPLDKPLPLALIKKMVKYRVGENFAKAKAKRARKI